MKAFNSERLVGPKPTPGRRIESVESHGKHLEIIWDDGIVLHTHMRMTGSWHLYRPGERWRKSMFQARAVIEVADWVAVCFNAPIVETYRLADPHRHPVAGRLGPDLCKPDADLERCAELMFNYADREATIGEVLLDQRVACGVGNVYKSETMFACFISPFAEVQALTMDDCRNLINTAAHLLRDNLERVDRVTDPRAAGGLAVYGRSRKTCVRCGTSIKTVRQGEQARSTYWCPACQQYGDRRAVVREEELNWSPTARGAGAIDPHPAAVRFMRDVEAATPPRGNPTPPRGNQTPARGTGTPPRGLVGASGRGRRHHHTSADYPDYPAAE
jgi:endonuclease VIII